MKENMNTNWEHFVLASPLVTLSAKVNATISDYAY